MSEVPARNGLAGESSPFLQHGSTQPVDWLPWSERVFERARAEQRPILLDIGAVWCHWCHVMDRESYEDAQTAALINELYIPVKVDRDERPDVDARYQRAVQLMTGQGGWPLTAFLTPDGELYYGGTYFPPVESHGRPSFQRVLREVARVWRDERPRALEAAGQITQRLDAAAAAEAHPGEISVSMVDDVLEELAQSFDFRFGGFGRAPKFPNAGALDLLLDEYAGANTEWAGRVVDESLTAMIRGGFTDQLGGGFHRYSTDARWLVPHFEKMSHDNGVLLATCARAAVTLHDEPFRSAAESVITFYHDVAGTLVGRGGFPASQDADHSPDDDGDYWTWTVAEIRSALGEPELVDAALLFFGLEDPASALHLDPSRHVLFQAMSLQGLARNLGTNDRTAQDRIARAVMLLKEVRDSRPAPYVDQTLYSGWVALVASGFLAAARHLGSTQAREDAIRALDRIWDEGFDASKRVLQHRIGDANTPEHVDDYAHVLLALLDAFEVTQEGVWLERASIIAQLLRERFTDPATHALRDRPVDEPGVVAVLDRPYLPVADAPSPSGNGAAALGQLRLHALNGDQAAHASALGILNAFAGSAAQIGSAAATYMKAVAWAEMPVTTVVIVESENDGPLLREALRTYRPRTVIRRYAPGTADTSALPPELAAMVTADAPRAYVCAGNTCAAPTREPAGLRETLLTLRG